MAERPRSRSRTRNLNLNVKPFKNHSMKNILLTIAIVLGVSLSAQQTPAPAQSGAISIQGATAHLGNGQVLENSLIVFEQGKLTYVGAANSSANKGQVIDASGKHVYPGFIVPSKSLGLVEVDAVRATNDQDEMGELIPHVRSIIAYNAESKVVESMRPNGVLIGQITPQGGTIAGTSSIVQFDAWNWEDAALKTDDGIHLEWPASFRRGRWWMGEERGFIPNKDYAGEVDQIKAFFRNSAAYAGAVPKERNLPFEAMAGLFDGSKKLYIRADGEREMSDAVTTATETGVNDRVIVGGGRA